MGKFAFRKQSQTRTTQETTQERIVAVLRLNPLITRRELANRLGLTPDVLSGKTEIRRVHPACGSDQGGALGSSKMSTDRQNDRGTKPDQQVRYAQVCSPTCLPAEKTAQS